MNIARLLWTWNLLHVVWSLVLQLKQPEVVTLVNGLSDSSVLTANGIHLGGQKYIYLRSDDTQIQGRKGDGGCSIAKANTCKYWVCVCMWSHGWVQLELSITVHHRTTITTHKKLTKSLQKPNTIKVPQKLSKLTTVHKQSIAIFHRLITTSLFYNITENYIHVQ